MRYLIAAMLPLALAHNAAADSWGEYMNRRIVDPTGTYYVVLTKAPGWQDDPGRGGPIDYAIAKRRGSDAVTPARDRFDHGRYEFIKDPNVKLRRGDDVTGKGRLERAPLDVLVSSTGMGFVAIDVYGYNYGDVSTRNAIIHVSSDGKIRLQKSWNELFDEDEIPLFTRTAGGTWWVRESWIDEVKRQVIVVGRSYECPYEAMVDKGKMWYLFRSISLESGAVQKEDSNVVLSALTQRNLGALAAAIPLALELEFADSVRILREIANDTTIPEPVRKQAKKAVAEWPSATD